MSWAESSWTVNQVVDKINKNFKVSPNYTLFKITDTDVNSNDYELNSNSIVINSFTPEIAGKAIAYIALSAKYSRSTGTVYISTISTPSTNDILNDNNVCHVDFNGNINSTNIVYSILSADIEANTTYYIHIVSSRGVGTLYSNSYIQYPNSSTSESVIKSIQSGNITDKVITINQVNPLKSVVIINNSSTTSSVALNKIMPTNITFSSTDSSGSWQLIEFY